MREYNHRHVEEMKRLYKELGEDEVKDIQLEKKILLGLIGILTLIIGLLYLLSWLR